MQIKIQDITGIPPYHLYKNARALLFEVECNCGFKTKKVFIMENKGEQK